MDVQQAADLLYGIVQAQLGQAATLDEIELQLLAAAGQIGISEDVVNVALSRFRIEKNPPDVAVRPQLFVDWGELPRVGQAARPEFSLICPQNYAHPQVRITIDRNLDHDERDQVPRLHQIEIGQWSCHAPFCMTTNGLDCLPGYYLFEVDVHFREATPNAPRFYYCRFRLHISHGNSEQGATLEIDGDGQSVVNLHGCNLSQFAKVVLKGGKDSIINLQHGTENAAVPIVPSQTEERVATVFEYLLKVHLERQSRLPKLLELGRPRAYTDAAALMFDDGRCVLVTTRSRITLGRGRDNDVVLRFMPSSDENDAHSRNISRTHCVVEFVADGIEIRDESRSGIEVDYSVVRERIVVPVKHASDAIAIDLGVTGTVPKAFRLELLLFVPMTNLDQAELEMWDELYSDLVGGRVSRLTRQGMDLRLDAIRFDRVDNLAGKEAYVVLLREALIGGSPHREAIVLKESGAQVQARLLHIDRSFWLEPMPGSHAITINDVPLPLHTLAPLVPGDRIQFGRELVTFERPTQKYLE